MVEQHQAHFYYPWREFRIQNRLIIKDIACLSGIGESTVSRILSSENRVSERTCGRVETVVWQHGFSLSHSTRIMRDQSGKAVAIIVTHSDPLSENLAVQTTLPAFYEQGYDPVTMESQLSPGLVEEHLGTLARRNINGVVLLGFTGIDEVMLAPQRDTLVLMTRDTPGFVSVCYDSEGTITLLMQRLYDRGHRRVSSLGVPHSDVTTGERHHSACLAFRKKYHLMPTVTLPGLGMKQGYNTVDSVLTTETSALVCTTDTLAFGASEYLQQQGRATLQLVSVGGTPLMKFLHPEILAIDPGYAESERHAVRQLIEQITGSIKPRQTVIPAVLN